MQDTPQPPTVGIVVPRDRQASAKLRSVALALLREMDVRVVLLGGPRRRWKRRRGILNETGVIPPHRVADRLALCDLALCVGNDCERAARAGVPFVGIFPARPHYEVLPPGCRGYTIIYPNLPCCPPGGAGDPAVGWSVLRPGAIAREVGRRLRGEAAESETLRLGAAPWPRRTYLSVIVLTANSTPRQLASTRRCLEHLSRHTSSRHELIVVDAGSDEQTVSYLKALATVRCMFLPAATSLSDAWNAGARVAGGNVIAFLHSDQYVGPDWDRDLLGELRGDVGIVGCECWTFTEGGALYEGDGHPERDFVRACGMMVRREVLAQLGGFTADLGPNFPEAADLCYRARRVGYGIAVVEGAAIHHVGNVTLGRADARLPASVAALMGRWPDRFRAPAPAGCDGAAASEPPPEADVSHNASEPPRGDGPSASSPDERPPKSEAPGPEPFPTEGDGPRGALPGYHPLDRVRVAFVVPHMFVGGGETQLLCLLRGMDRAKFQPDVLVLERGAYLGTSLEDEVRQCCSVHEVGGQALDRWLALRGQLARLQPHVVVFHGTMAVGHAWHSADSRPAVIQIMHCDDSGSSTQPYLESAGVVDHVVCVQGALAQWARGFVRVPVTTILNGVDERLLAGSEDLCGEWSLDPAALVVGYVGRLCHGKGVDRLIEAMALLDDDRFRLVVVGWGDYEEGLRNLARRLEVSERVVFAGLRRDIGKVMRSLDVLCLASESEGLPMSVIEAMLCGTPALVTPVGGLPEIVEDGRTGWLLDSTDPKHIAERLGQLAGYRRDGTLARVGRASQQYAQEHLTARRMAREYQDLICELVEQRRGRERLLVVDAAGGIGDTLMTTPALHALRGMCPRADITVATPHPWVFAGSPDVNRAARPHDLACDGQFDHQVTLEHPDVWDTGVHIIEKNLRLVGAPSTAGSVPLLHLTEAELRAGAERAHDLGRAVVIHPTSPIATKLWPREYWEEIVEYLQGRGFAVAQVGAAGEHLIPGATSWLGVDFREIAGALKQCAFAVCIDSSVQHAAAAVGCRAVVLFSGAAPPELASYAQHVNVVTPSDCRCAGSKSGTIKCSRDVECMRALTPEHVIRALAPLASEGRRKRPN